MVTFPLQWRRTEAQTETQHRLFPLISPKQEKTNLQKKEEQNHSLRTLQLVEEMVWGKKCYNSRRGSGIFGGHLPKIQVPRTSPNLQSNQNTIMNPLPFPHPIIMLKIRGNSWTAAKGKLSQGRNTNWRHNTHLGEETKISLEDLIVCDIHNNKFQLQ